MGYGNGVVDWGSGVSMGEAAAFGEAWRTNKELNDAYDKLSLAYRQMNQLIDQRNQAILDYRQAQFSRIVFKDTLRALKRKYPEIVEDSSKEFLKRGKEYNEYQKKYGFDTFCKRAEKVRLKSKTATLLP